MTKNNRILNCIRSRNTERDWRIEHAIMSEQITKEELISIPAEKDLREGCEKWWKIGDQGQTGSCVGWASTDSVLRWHFGNAGRLAKATPVNNLTSIN
jgi:hypothetical protein